MPPTRCCCFLALLMATGARAKSAVVAALFALHPLHVESVAWVAERKDVLSTLFGFLSLAGVCAVRDAGRAWRLAASLGFLVGSLLSKQTLVTLPFVLLLLDYWPLGPFEALGRSVSATPGEGRGVRSGRERRGRVESDGPRRLGSIPERRRPTLRLVLKRFPFSSFRPLFCGGRPVGPIAQRRGDVAQRFSVRRRAAQTPIIVYVAYLGKTLFPQNLAVYYPHPHEQLDLDCRWSGGDLLLAITAAAIVFVRRYPFRFRRLVLVSRHAGPHDWVGADRFAADGRPVHVFSARWTLPGRHVAGSRIGAGRLAPRRGSFRRLCWRAWSCWRPRRTARSAIGTTASPCLRHSMECTPDNSVAHEFLGSAYLSEGANQRGGRRAGKGDPPGAGVCSAASRFGRPPCNSSDGSTRRRPQYREALALDPQSPQAHTELGLVLFKRRQYEDAQRHYRQALEIDPDFVPARVNLAALCLTTEDYAGAINDSERVLRLQPDLPASQMCIAMALRGQGHLDAAIRRFQHVMELTPNDPIARDELARTLAMKQHASTK